MKLQHILIVSATLLFCLTLPDDIRSQPIQEKASTARADVYRNLTAMRAMVLNFPCDPLPACKEPGWVNPNPTIPSRMKRYEEMKRLYQEGFIFYYQGMYTKAYFRFVDCKIIADRLLEDMSQYYVDRAETMMRDAMEKENPNDPNDKSVIDVSFEFTSTGKMYDNFMTDRDTSTESKRYDSKVFHYYTNRYWILESTKMGYRYLDYAKQARRKALMLTPRQNEQDQLEDYQTRIKRSDLYLSAIESARISKHIAVNIYKLKYPYQNYPFLDPQGRTEAKAGVPREVAEIDSVRMNWYENQYASNLRKLSPVLDLRVPMKYRVDHADARGIVYDEEADIVLKLKYDKNKDKLLKDEGTQPAAPAPQN